MLMIICQYFLPASEWVEWREALRGDKQVASVFFEGGEGDKGGEGAGEAPQEPEPSVPADESQEACAICGERFETVCDEANEVWMYPSALYLSVDRTGPLDPTAAPNAPRGTPPPPPPRVGRGHERRRHARRRDDYDDDSDGLGLGRERRRAPPPREPLVLGQL
eukprot:tig00000396_g24885.t1